MARTTWKQVERDAAAVIGAKRHWANAGERVDADSPHFAAQVKNPKSLALNTLTLLVEEMTVIGIDHQKIPVVFVKQSARRPTPLMAVLPAEVLALLWRRAAWAADGKGDSFAFTIEAAATLKETPGMRKRVGAFVEKSKARGGYGFTRRRKKANPQPPPTTPQEGSA